MIKRLRAGVWKTIDIVIGGQNPTDINFAHIGNQLQFIDTIKYFQQSLAALAGSLTSSEKAEISKTCENYLLNDQKLSTIFLFLTKTEKEWVLDYLSSGKGTIPYELIATFDSLSISPDKEYFEPHQVYSSMKDSIRLTQEYENVKCYTTLKLSSLGELNQIYNFQDTIILCKIFEQRLCLFQRMVRYNLRKCNTASSFSGCVHRNKSKSCIALPTDAELVIAFKETLIGGFSSVNTRLAFDTDVLLNDNNEKVLFDLDIDGKKQAKRISSKILKMDERNQYGMAMTKPLPYSCIKKKDNEPSLTEFNRIITTTSHEDKIGYLFIVDIKFHDINGKTLLFNELYPPIFLKNKKIDPYEKDLPFSY